ncbi:glycosyltransferase family 2 protein [Pedobacter sp. AW1-32]|uniref:glycosyltransferase family 2 protein n=1 Tax=Pedobacter sp. AW1-32 TaxID=3383026 RepID=UPI003FF07A41
MEDNKVSIIIPTFNYGHLIAETLNYLQDQTYQFWEAIIIDDGSTDNTEEVVNSFVKNDKRFIYIKKENQGVSAARNSGLALASGEYIQFLDADDLISADKIGLQVEFLRTHLEVDISTTSTKFFHQNNLQILYTDFGLTNKTSMPIVDGIGYPIIESLIQRNLLVIQSPLFRKNILNIIGYFADGMNYLEDWDFWFRAALQNMRFSYLKDELAYGLVRIHNASATQQSSKIIRAEIFLRDRIGKHLLSSGLKKEQKEKLIIKNKFERINSYKKIMAQIPLRDLKTFKGIFEEIDDAPIFFKAFFKALNLKRKFK